ncbi:Protein HID1 [Symbiodinium microadriaticum]|uniref:Protein HID1 n=1 Tax=Symbiodinium microadriaticum TaxID=2951 RepID=A0A1Q9ESU5_SYMMI|nr:Protein HID1 [Symbiodinium microadriaticum]
MIVLFIRISTVIFLEFYLQPLELLSALHRSRGEASPWPWPGSRWCCWQSGDTVDSLSPQARKMTVRESPPQWLRRFVSGEVCHTANIFCSLLSTVCRYDPIGRGVPYGGYFSSNSQEDFVDKALQVLCVALDFKPPQEDAEQDDNDAADAGWFLVDNSQLQANSHGVGYRASKMLEDIVPSKSAVWGERIPGHDEGDGWIKVGDYFLPAEINGHRVLLPQSQAHRYLDECPPCVVTVLKLFSPLRWLLCSHVLDVCFLSTSLLQATMV